MLKKLNIFIVSLSLMASFSHAQQIIEFEKEQIKYPIGNSMKLPLGKKALLKTGTFKNDEVFLELPYEYTRTGTLKSDVSVLTIVGNITLLRAGSIAYWVDGFSKNNSLLSEPNALWCVFDKTDNLDKLYGCIEDKKQLFNNSYGVITLKSPPYIKESYSSLNIRYVNNFEIDESKPVEFGDLKIKYSTVLRGKNKDLYVVGKINDLLVTEIKLIKKDDKYIWQSPVGDTEFTLDEINNVFKISYNTNNAKSESKPQTSINNNLSANDKRILNILTKIWDEKASIYEKIDNIFMNFIDEPEPVKDLQISKNVIIVQQKIEPVKFYSQKPTMSNSEFAAGKANAIWFGVNVIAEESGKYKLKELKSIPANGLRQLLCTHNWEKLKEKLSKSNQSRANEGVCIEDIDNDGKYETLYRTTKFVINSLYQAEYFGSILQIPEAPIEFEEMKTRPDVPSETIGLRFDGLDDYKLNDKNGKLMPTNATFNWVYLTGPHGSSNYNENLPTHKSIDTLYLKVNNEGKATYKNDKGEVLFEITSIDNNGNATVTFNKYYEKGINPLFDFKTKAKKYKEDSKSMKEIIK